MGSPCVLAWCLYSLLLGSFCSLCKDKILPALLLGYTLKDLLVWNWLVDEKCWLVNWLCAIWCFQVSLCNLVYCRTIFVFTYILTPFLNYFKPITELGLVLVESGVWIAFTSFSHMFIIQSCLKNQDTGNDAPFIWDLVLGAGVLGLEVLASYCTAGSSFRCVGQVSFPFLSLKCLFKLEASPVAWGSANSSNNCCNE